MIAHVLYLVNTVAEICHIHVHSSHMLYVWLWRALLLNVCHYCYMWAQIHTASRKCNI